MKTIFFVLFLSVICVIVNGWVAVIKRNETVVGSTGCFTSIYDIGQLNSREERRIQGICAVARCQDNGDISVSGCGVAQAAPPCRLIDGDLSKSYPDCCFELICPDDDNKL